MRKIENSSVEVDALTRKRCVTLHQLRKTIPADYLQIDSLRSWTTLLRVLISSLCCLFLLTRLELQFHALWWQIPALFGIWTLYGWVLVGLFVIGHECGHGLFSKRGWVNTWIGSLTMAPLANSFQSWTLTHDHHHVFTQLRGEEVDWANYLATRQELQKGDLEYPVITRLGYRLPFGILFWIWWNAIRRGVAVKGVLSTESYQAERKKLLFSNTFMLICLSGIYGGLWLGLGFWPMLKYHGIPATIAMLTGYVIIAVQHAGEGSILYDKDSWTPVQGQIVSTFDTRLPRWLEYIWCNINLHIPHHILPLIPWYRLPDASEILRTKYPDYYQERRFGIQHLKWLYRTPYLKKDSQNGYYILESVRPLQAESA